MLDLLEKWLRHKRDMINFEAARAICEMKNTTSAQLTKFMLASPSLLTQHTQLIINSLALQFFLSSPKPMLKFAAARTLTNLALSRRYL